MLRNIFICIKINYGFTNIFVYCEQTSFGSNSEPVPGHAVVCNPWFVSVCVCVYQLRK